MDNFLRVLRNIHDWISEFYKTQTVEVRSGIVTGLLVVIFALATWFIIWLHTHGILFWLVLFVSLCIAVKILYDIVYGEMSR